MNEPILYAGIVVWVGLGVYLVYLGSYQRKLQAKLNQLRFVQHKTESDLDV